MSPPGLIPHAGIEAAREDCVVTDQLIAAADGTAVRVALRRAMHVAVDAPPCMLHDEIGLRLAAPDDSRRRRAAMDPGVLRLFRGSAVGRARLIDDLVVA